MVRVLSDVRACGTMTRKHADPDYQKKGRGKAVGWVVGHPLLPGVGNGTPISLVVWRFLN